MANIFCLESITIQDEVGVKATLPIYLSAPDTVTLAQLITAAKEHAVKADAITGGQIVDCQVKVEVGAIAGTKSAPVAGSRVEQTGLFNFFQTGSKYKWPIDVPAIADTALANGRVDLTNADVIAFFQDMSTTISGIFPISKWIFAIAGLIDVATTFRKHRKQMIRDTFEEN